MNITKKIALVVLLVSGNIAQWLQAEYPESFVEDGKIVCELKTEEYVALIRPFLPANPVILEAGCHGGQDTVILGQSWPRGHVYAFEPVMKFVGFTKEELRKHGVRNASVWPFALSVTSGEQLFHYSTNIGAASSLLPSNDKMDHICKYNDTPMKVNCINLDEWAKKNKVDHIDFMWLDMEGIEYYVLNAAPNILKTVRVIITEINFCEFRQGTTQYKDLYNFLTAQGFKLYKIWGSPIWQGTALFIRP